MKTEGIYRMPEGKREWQAPLPQNAPAFDAVVVGGGTAGAISAAVIAESGAKVLLIERAGALGGTGTLGGISSYYYGSEGGFYEEIDRAAREREKDGFPGRKKNGFNAEMKESVLERRIRAAGGVIRFRAELTGVLMKGNRVTGVEFFAGRGFEAAEAKVVIDATADALTSLLAGAKVTLGRERDHSTQPFSLVRIEVREDPVRLAQSNTDCGYADPADPEDYSRAVSSAALYPLYLRGDFRAGSRLVAMAAMPGMREGPLVEGDERVSFEDAVSGKNQPEKILFTAFSNADNHGKDMALEDTAQKDWMIACSLWGVNFSVDIPVGAVIPKGIDGLLTAGRMISVDHDLASCVRQQRDVQKCGEAVGVLASEAIRRGVSVRDVPYAALEKRLRESGCLSEENRVGFADTRGGVFPVRFPETEEEIRQGLASASPGLALWAARGRKDLSFLYDCLKKEGHLGVHAAMALALAGDGAGADVLIECVKKRDPFRPETSRKYNVIRTFAALYLLGRLACKKALPAICGILNDPAPVPFQPDEFLKDEEDARFQAVSQAVMALEKIAAAHPDVREEADRAVHAFLDRQDLVLLSTFKGQGGEKFDMAPHLRRAVRLAEERR